MTHEGASVASLRSRVPTGYGRLDEALQGGFLAGTAIVLSAPASDEVPLLIGNFLRASKEQGLLITRTFSSAETITQNMGENVRSLVCSDKPVSPARTIIPGKGIENLTDLNLQIGEVIASTQPKRLVIDILSDILLRHKTLQTRKWLTELLERLRSKGITTLTVLNPYMHASEEVQAVVDLFDGNLEIIEKDVEGQLQKFLRIKWMHGVEAVAKELPLLDLVAERLEAIQQSVVVVTPFKDPRWRTSLVGRTAELSKLKVAFENALSNSSSVVALQGEAGVGKTRLMQELGVYAQSKGATVLTGNASEAGLAYAPWIELTRQYVAQAPGELLRRMLGPHASEIVKLVPDIAVKLGTIPPSKPLGEQEDKIRFYEAVTQFFIAICGESPLLLLFDDMHLVDRSSLELLEYFVRSTSNLRVLTVCSNRAEEVQLNSPLYQTLMKFNRQRLLETIQVKNLNKEETAELIRQTFGEQVISSEFADLMYHRTGGNPFFVEEVLRSLVEDGTIFRTESKWDRKPIQEIVLPESVKSLLKSRLTKLQPETLNILTVASVIGSEFDFEVLREVMQTQEDTLLDRIETVVTAGLISEVPGRKDVFRFVDNRIRELLLGDLLQSRRTRYHVKIAEAMEKAYSKNLENRAESIAAHFSEGGDTERTIKYSVMAGDRNRAIHAYEQAIADYKRALDLIELEGGKDGEKAVAKEKLAECYRMAYQLQDSTRSYQDALEIFEKLHDSKACARVCVGLSKTVIGERLSAGIRDAITVLRRGLKYLEAEQESFEAATIYAQLASNYGIIDEWDEANAWADKALSVGEKVQNYAAIAVSLSIKGSFLTDTGRIDEGLPLWQRAFDLSLQHEQYEDAVYYLVNLSAYTFPRDIARARELAVRRIEICKRVNLVFYEAVGWYWLSEFDWYGGDWKAAREEHQKSCDIANRLGSSVALSYLALGRGRFSLSMGDLEQAEIEFQEGLDTLRENPKITDIVSYHLALGMLREEQGREREAEEHYVTCVDSFRRWEFTTSPLLHVETLLHLTSIYAKHQELEKARETSQWAKRLAETLKSDAGLAMASQAEASLLLATGERKGAEEAYLKSLGLWEKAGWPYYRAKALVAYCEAIAQTDPTESRRHLEQAAEIFKKLGAKRDLEKAEAKLSAKA